MPIESRRLDRRIVRFPASDAVPNNLYREHNDLLVKPGAFLDWVGNGLCSEKRKHHLGKPGAFYSLQGSAL
ncbi:hypothetical protein SH449x_000290 [Pirellulaceae bacterium SH449]